MYEEPPSALFCGDRSGALSLADHGWEGFPDEKGCERKADEGKGKRRRGPKESGTQSTEFLKMPITKRRLRGRGRPAPEKWHLIFLTPLWKALIR